MTIRMPDSITPGNIPLGYPAVLGYADGKWATAASLPHLFPKSRHLILTVTGADDSADGCDQESGDLGPNSAAMWLKHQLLSGKWRPVLYASRDSVPLTLAILAPLGVARSQIRIVSAHYGKGEHICSPSACGATFTADGTQWTDQFPGIGTAKIDMSLLADNFFGTPASPADWVFSTPRALTAKAGHTSVELTWSAPNGPAPEAVHHYQVTVRHAGQDEPSYPRDVAKGANPEVHSFGSLLQGTAYEAMVRAVAVNGHASPWAVADFTTGHA